MISEDSEITHADIVTGLNIEDVLEQIVTRLPAPEGDENGELQALIFDSKYDNYMGAVSHVRIVNGKVKMEDAIYDLQGLKINSQLKKGVYVVNGEKKVMK